MLLSGAVGHEALDIGALHPQHPSCVWAVSLPSRIHLRTVPCATPASWAAARVLMNSSPWSRRSRPRSSSWRTSSVISVAQAQPIDEAPASGVSLARAHARTSWGTQSEHTVTMIRV